MKDCAAAESPLQEAGIATLDLILPQDLPAELWPGPAEAAALGAGLRALLDALALDAPQARAEALGRLLPGHAPPPSAPAVIATGIPAGPAEVEDFDRYFHVRRIAAEDPARALLAALIRGAASAASLAARTPDLPADLVAHQNAGFAAQARLIARVCGIEDLR